MRAIADLYTALRKSNLWWWDISARNVGFVTTDKKKMAVLLDFDAVCDDHDLEKSVFGSDISRGEWMVSAMRQLGLKQKMIEIPPEFNRNVFNARGYQAQLCMPVMRQDFDIDSRMPVRSR